MDKASEYIRFFFKEPDKQLKKIMRKSIDSKLSLLMLTCSNITRILQNDLTIRTNNSILSYFSRSTLSSEITITGFTRKTMLKD